MRRFEFRTVEKFSLALCVLFLLKTVAFARADDLTPQTFDIAPQALASALTEFARQSHEAILFAPDVVATKRTAGVKGTMTAVVALKVLLKDSALPFSSTPSGAILVGNPNSNGVQNTSSTSTSANDQPNKEGDKSSSSFRVAQVDQAPGGVEIAQTQSQKTSPPIEEVVVTGSRIPTVAGQGTQEVKTYSQEQIQQSGQTTVADFLNTIPDASVSLNENGLQSGIGTTSIQLHGLPLGTTLVLLNGRRLQTSGTAINSFDLNTIPLAAVDRIEVLSSGSSAVYGSDAIAGVVNIILKKSFSGLAVDASYGAASDTHQSDFSAAWGDQWSGATLSVIATYLTRSELDGFDRSITADSDFRKFGGIDARVNYCNPGNIFSLSGANLPGVGAPYAAVPPGYTGPPSQAEFAGTAGTLNECSVIGYLSLIPATHRTGILAEGTLDVALRAELFTEVSVSYVEEFNETVPPDLYGAPGYQQYTVSATNPFNPFGESVGVADLLTALGPQSNPAKTLFVRALAGLRGGMGDWHWEFAGWDSFDNTRYSDLNYPNPTAIQAALDSSTPSTALNPFVAGPQGSPQLLQSLVTSAVLKYGGEEQTVNAFVHGPLFYLPAGAVRLVLGAEYNHEGQSFESPNTVITSPSYTNFHRSSEAVFGETHVPVLGSANDGQQAQSVDLTLAGRYDHYSDFGGRFTPQVGLQWRPVSGLQLRGTYSQAFKAPWLAALYQGKEPYQTQVTDPLHGGLIEEVTAVNGGNPKLLPETGNSHTFGISYAHSTAPDFRVSISNFGIRENNSIQSLAPQVIVQNESLFPGLVTRNSAGIITNVDSMYINFGAIDVNGMEYQLDYHIDTAVGQFSSSASATQTYHYTTALVPGAPATNRAGVANDDGNFAPRWKGTLALGWKQGPYSAGVDGRYVGKYQDYDSTQEIGNFWLCDANARISLKTSATGGLPRESYVQIGGVNLFNKLPVYSNYFFGLVGYDPAEYDIRGRYIYVKVGANW